MQLRSKQEQLNYNANANNANGLFGDEAENGGRHRGNSDGDSDSDDDSEFDYLLDDDLPTSSGNNIGNDNDNDNNNDNHNGNDMSTYQSFQQERMEELQVNALIYESALHHGFGAHRQISAQRVLHCAGMGMGGIKRNRAAAIPPAAVVHLYKDNDMCASLDICLEELSQTYRGTKYVRADGRDTLSMNAALVKETLPMSKLSTDSGIPALLAVRDGVVVAVCPNLSALGNERDGTIEPRAVEHWLDNARVLLLNVPLEFEDYCRVRPEEDALLENMMREKAKLDEMKLKEMIYNCGVSGCCKTFRHEHVGVQNEMQSGLLCKETNTGEMIGGGGV